MPNRVVSERLLDHPQYWAVSIEAQRLYIHGYLLSCDFNCLPLSPLFLRRAFKVRPGPTKLESLIQELFGQDLWRVYFAGSLDSPERYAFIPRFANTVKWKKAKYPMPPFQLFADDKTAIKKFQENNELFADMESGRMQPGCRPDTRVGIGVGEGTEKKKEQVQDVAPSPGNATASAPPQPPADARALKDSEPETRGYRQRAAEMDLTQNPGETDAEFMVRTMQTANQRKTA